MTRVGFEAPDPIVKLRFEDPDFDGLEVRVHSASMEDFLAIMRWKTGAWRPDEGEGVEVLKVMGQEWERIVDRFAGLLIDWNLERHGEPVPASREGIRAQTPDLVKALINAWTDAVTGVSGPLGKPSPNGDPSLMESMPMEVSSPSL